MKTARTHAKDNFRFFVDYRETFGLAPTQERKDTIIRLINSVHNIYFDGREYVKIAIECSDHTIVKFEKRYI
jgi:hypothetical protein